MQIINEMSSVDRLRHQDGYETTKMIRKAEDPSLAPYKDVPIVAVTATEMMGDRDRAKEAGMNDFTLKPLHNDALRQILERFLNTETAAKDFSEDCSTQSFEPRVGWTTPTTPGGTPTGAAMATMVKSKEKSDVQ